MKKSDSLTNITEEKTVKTATAEYKITSVKIDGKPIEEYTVCYNCPKAKNAAVSFRDELYSKVGVRVDLADMAPAGCTPSIQFNVLENSGVGNGFEVKVEGGNLIFNCEFAYMLESISAEVYKKYITEADAPSVSLSSGVLSTKDVRNIYYDAFGAVGDGVTNDFSALVATHDWANKHGHTVNGTKGKTYYIGSTGGKSIIVMTDVNWNGCNFIFDDSVVPVHNVRTCPHGASRECVSCEERRAAIFAVRSSYAPEDVTDLFAQFNKDNPMRGGYGKADNTTVIPGWNLPYDALVHIQSAEKRVYIRLGMNATAGELLGEYILVHKDGTIDPKTPLTWDYAYVSSAKAYNADPEFVKPITLNGGGATITTIANRPGADVGNEYISFSRNLLITRSNTTVMGINHRVKESMADFRSPYNGIIYARFANNITYRDITVQTMYRRFHGALYCGSYVIGTFGCNDVKFYNLRTMEFFSDGTKPKNADGEFYPEGCIHEPGFFGSNYCRNFYFENCKLNSFDSHKGSGNVTLKNCMLGCFYALGSGDILLEDTVFYLDRTRQVITLRADYVTSWRGSVKLKNVDLRYAIDPPGDIILFDSGRYKPNDCGEALLDETTGEYLTGDGWTSYLPEKITLENVTLTKFTYTKYDRETDTVDEREVHHSQPIRLFNPTLYQYGDTNLAVDYPHKLIPTDELSVSNCNLELIVPKTPQFRNMKYLLDGECQP
ncbi:MAG: hypothetical protein J6Q69_01315 [Clostridia bacterium]|nr:hypothetical protein [Clostridia bacterium]